MGETSSAILTVRNLRTSYRRGKRLVPAVDGVCFEVRPNEAIGLVGESGCGKSSVAYSLLRLISPVQGTIEADVLNLGGTDLLPLTPREMTKVRGQSIAMVFQNPMTYLNPVFAVGHQIGEAIRLHQGGSGTQVREKVQNILKLVGIPDPVVRARQYPHQLSGGMQQRVLLAIALSCRPQVLVADEPTTALDVTVQSQILSLISDLRARLGMALVLITHDLHVVARQVDRVLVMYAGRVVEDGAVDQVLRNPCHPYTRGLLASIPGSQGDVRRLAVIPGTVLDLGQPFQGCRYRPRCLQAVDRCSTEEPGLIPVSDGPSPYHHSAACWVSGSVDQESP